MVSETIFATTGLGFAYQPAQPVLQNVSVGLKKGHITALLGANGCGKSTLFNLLGGYYKPTKGEITFCGKPLTQWQRKAFARRVALVQQQNTAPADMSVRKLVTLGRAPYKTLRATRAAAEADRHAVETAMRLTDIHAFAERPVASLSGGQRQRVWLALALAQSKEVVLLDEITTYLDIYYQLEIMQLLTQLNRDYGTTIAIVLHDINQALQYCSDAVIMQQGQILAAGEVQRVLTAQNVSTAFGVQASIENVQGKQYCIYELERA